VPYERRLSEVVQTDPSIASLRACSRCASSSLRGVLELAGDLGLADTGSHQLSRPQPAGLEPVTLLLCRWAARTGMHRILTWTAAEHQPGPDPHIPQPDTR
jgi:hypothetical protein